MRGIVPTITLGCLLLSACAGAAITGARVNVTTGNAAVDAAMNIALAPFQRVVTFKSTPAVVKAGERMITVPGGFAVDGIDDMTHTHKGSQVKGTQIRMSTPFEDGALVIKMLTFADVSAEALADGYAEEFLAPYPAVGEGNERKETLENSGAAMKPAYIGRRVVIAEGETKMGAFVGTGQPIIVAGTPFLAMGMYKSTRGMTPELFAKVEARFTHFVKLVSESNGG